MSFEYIKSYTTHHGMPDVTGLVKYIINPNDDVADIMTKADFANTTNWSTLDWSSFVTEIPMDAILIHVHMYIRDNALSWIRWRYPDNVNSGNAVTMWCPVINLYFHYNELVPAKSGNSNYQLSIAANNWANLNLSVIGWFTLV